MSIENKVFLISFLAMIGFIIMFYVSADWGTASLGLVISFVIFLIIGVKKFNKWFRS